MSNNKHYLDKLKEHNENTYRNGCEHKDRACSDGMIECRSCGYKEIWGGENYEFRYIQKEKYEIKL